MKHLLLSASLLLFASNLTAQLHVSPSATADSYIYANDVVIYVEQDINLVNNVNPETRASIYLRGDSQLIQGTTGTSTNSGNGSLSVWQRGWANAFDYNYWASPVGNPNDPAIPTGNTNFGIPRIFDAQNDGGSPHKTHSLQQQTTWALNGVPSRVEEDITGLQVSRRWIYTLRMGTQYIEWVHIANQTGIGNGLAAGEGFTMKGTGSGVGTTFENAHNQLYDFRGRPNDGNITVAVGPEQVTLTGNPYPSALDMREFLLDTQNASTIEGYAYYWDQSRTTNSHYIQAYEGGYGTWQPNGTDDHPIYGNLGIYVVPTYIRYDGSGVPIPGEVGVGDPIQRRFAPIGQGFMVKGIANGYATFGNSMRRHVRQSIDTTSVFRNTGNDSSLSATAIPAIIPAQETTYLNPIIRLDIEINNLYVRDMVLILSDETTKGADRGWDSKHPSVIDSGDTFWVLENETDPYVIQSRPFDYMELIPLGLKVRNGSNTFKIRAAEMHGFGNLSESHGAEIRLYLYDQLNNQYQRISPEHTAMINHNGNAGKIEDRYFIVYRRGIIDDAASLKSTMANVNFFQNNPQSKLEVSNPDVLDIRNASIYDMRGRLVLTENNIGKVAKFSFPTGNLSTGVYIVKLSTTENGIIDYKITVHNR